MTKMCLYCGQFALLVASGPLVILVYRCTYVHRMILVPKVTWEYHEDVLFRWAHFWGELTMPFGTGENRWQKMSGLNLLIFGIEIWQLYRGLAFSALSSFDSFDIEGNSIWEGWMAFSYFKIHENELKHWMVVQIIIPGNHGHYLTSRENHVECMIGLQFALWYSHLWLSAVHIMLELEVG